VTVELLREIHANLPLERVKGTTKNWQMFQRSGDEKFIKHYASSLAELFTASL
jgi:hypothetical protein